jgi:hypothetical protein
MAAIALVPKVFPIMHLVPKIIRATILTTLDWINIPDTKGVLLPLPAGTVATANNTSCNITTVNYGECYSTAVYTATATTIAVDTALADATNGRLVPYYLKCPSGEMMEVLTDSLPKTAASTLTVRRGVLGSTAAAIADNDRFSIMNQLVLTNGTAVGTATTLVFDMPQDSGVKLFA